jgi:hypothetical protein
MDFNGEACAWGQGSMIGSCEYFVFIKQEGKYIR